MQYDQDPIGTLTPLPAKNIDTGLGLNRMALIQQGVDSIFETDQFLPLMTLGRDLATSEPDERALRILADHTRGMTFLIADGVVPSNEDRGYVLRRIMRRALLQGHRIGIEHGFLPQYVSLVVDLMGAGYPELLTQHETIDKWVRAEEESFGRTLEQGTQAARRPARPRARSRAPTPSACTTPTASRSSSRARSPPSAACRSRARPTSSA